jgi:hypothetical protein
MTSYVQPLRSAGWGHQVGARLSARLDAARTAARARAAATRFRLALPVTGGHALPVLFAAYHLHFPWLIPVNLLDMFISRTRRSGIRALGSGSSCTAPRACLRRPSSSHLFSEQEHPGQKATGTHGRRST